MESIDGTTKSTANCGSTDESTKPSTHEKTQETVSSTTAQVTLKSPAWTYFVKSEDPAYARCIHCSQMIKCKTKHGSTTSAILKHQKICKMIRPEVTDGEIDGKKMKQTTLHHQNETDGSSVSKVASFLAFSQTGTRKALVEMIIMDELPFRFVERKGFRRFMSIAQPRFEIPCRKTVAKDCLLIF